MQVTVGVVNGDIEKGKTDQRREVGKGRLFTPVFIEPGLQGIQSTMGIVRSDFHGVTAEIAMIEIFGNGDGEILHRRVAFFVIDRRRPDPAY